MNYQKEDAPAVAAARGEDLGKPMMHPQNNINGRPPHPVCALDEAIALAERSIPVFPCHPVSKRPLTANGFYDATTAAEAIRGWWKRWPEALVGVPAGDTSGLLVLDVDPAGEPWAAEHDEFLTAAGRIHHTRRGRHYLYTHADGVSSSVGKVAPGIDIRAAGGYVIWWPAHGFKTYGDLDDVAPAPAGLLALLLAPEEQKGRTGDHAQAATSAITEGGRNDYLSREAYRLRRQGSSVAQILRIIGAMNKARCDPPLDGEELERIAAGKRRIEADSSDTLGDEASILAAAAELSPESPPGDVSALIEAATRKLKPVARQRLYGIIKERTGIPLGALRQEAASAFKEAEGEAPDHLDLARKVVSSIGDKNVLCIGGDVWLWDEAGVWRRAQDRQIKGWVQRVIESEVDVVKNRVDGVFDIVKTEVFRPRHEWNPDDDIINLANGELRLAPAGAQLEPHSREHYRNTQIPIEYKPDAPCPENWLRFLASVWPDDPESIDTLQEIFGLLLTADTRHQKIFLIAGPKRGGKGTIARVLGKLLGTDSVCGPTLSSLQQNFGLQPLIGKSLALISDARLGSRAEQHIITERLLSVSGEDALSIPRKYQEDWTGQLTARFLILTNETPRLADSSGALASRFIVLKMTKSFLGREDIGLDRKLAAELPGILNWAIAGLYRLRQRGFFHQPASAQEALEELGDLGSPVSAFLRDACVVAPGATVSCQELYDAWRGWCAEQGREHPGTLQTFSRDVRAALPEVRTSRPRAGAGGRYRVFSGLGLGGGPRWSAVPTIVRNTREHTKVPEEYTHPEVAHNGLGRGPPRTAPGAPCPKCLGDGCAWCGDTGRHPDAT